MRHPAVFMSMGRLYVNQGKWTEAQRYLEKVKDDPKFKAGAAHGLGQAFMGLKQQKQAAGQLISALRLVDTSLALNHDEAQELNAVYNALLKSALNKQEADLSVMNEQFNKWLIGKDWKVRIAETRRALAERLAAEGEDAL